MSLPRTHGEEQVSFASLNDFSIRSSSALVSPLEDIVAGPRNRAIVVSYVAVDGAGY